MAEKVKKQPMVKLSIGSFYYALNGTEFTEAGFTGINYSDILKSIGVTAEAESVKQYASGKVVGTFNQTSGTDIAAEVIAFDPEDLYTLRGETVGENGLVFGGGSSERPYVAIGYTVIKNGGVHKFIWYPKCQLIENTEDVATSEGSFSEQNDTLTFTALAFNDAGQLKVELDTETLKGKGITEDAFFAQVILKESDLAPGA